MARGYSNDLKARAVANVEDGESAREAVRLLNIGASTAIRWIERIAETGSVAATRAGSASSGACRTDIGRR
jgi:transposase